MIVDEGGARTYYAWGGEAVVAEYIEYGASTIPQWTKSYIYLGARLLATLTPGTGSEFVQFQHPDRLGTRLVTNATDTSQAQEQVSLPFGTALEAESSGTTNRRFTSYDRSSTTGLDYAVNRHYSSGQGRFTQADPIGAGASSLADPQSLNLYAYCGNDPINHTDPDGLFWGKLFHFFGKAVGIFNKILKWVAVAVAITVVVLFVFQPEAIPGFLGWFAKLGAKIGLGYAEGGGLSTGTKIFAGVFSAVETVGAVANHLQDKKKAKKPNKYIVAAVANAAKILSGDNPCSKFFGSNAQDALKDLGESMQVESLGNTTTGISMSPPVTDVQNAATGASYRRFESVRVNRDGPFFNPLSKARVGGYNPASPQSQTLQVLHEVAHKVKGPNGGWLIPDDGKGAPSGQSERNTAEVLTHCKGEIDKIK